MLQKRPIILRSLLIVGTPHYMQHMQHMQHMQKDYRADLSEFFVFGAAQRVVEIVKGQLYFLVTELFHSVNIVVC